MKKSLYHITNEFIEIRDALTDGELTPELEQALEINEKELSNKAVNYSFIIKDFENRVSAINEEIKRLQALKKTATNAVDRLKKNVAGAMETFGVEKIEHDLITLSLRKSQSVQIADDLVPMMHDEPALREFTVEKTTYSFDKNALKNALKSGREFDGVQLVENKSLQIK